jgi:hypothetical protein
MVIELSLSGNDLEALAQHISQQPYFRESPETLEVDYAAQPITHRWASLMGSAAKVFEAVWDDERRLAVYNGLTVEVTLPLPPEPETIIDWLARLDFELASFFTLHPEWQTIDPDYFPPSFANRHRAHGAFAAIKGAGQRHLVSERWLDYSPIKLTQRDDLSFIQFHDLEADAATSLAQAKPGHIALSSEPQGGFIKQGYLLRHDFNGVLDEKTGVLKVAVLGRAVSPREMLDARAARGEVKGKMVNNVGFVFLDETEIGDHLYELWRRGLECWTIREGREVRLDDSYVPPPPVTPDWATGTR